MTNKNLTLAKTLRKNMTKEEIKLWNILRNKKYFVFKFKRQVPIGDYIVDFICESKKLIIEIDGSQHNTPENIIKDNDRTKYLQEKGYIIIRFWNFEVWNNIEGVISVINRYLK